MNKKLGMLGLSLALSFSQVADANQDSVITPKLSGQKFAVDCRQDFNAGQPTLDFLGRYSSHMHGETDPVNGRNTNLYTASDREARVEKNVSKNFMFMSQPRKDIAKKSAIAHMNQIFSGYDNASDKKAFLINGLRSHNWHGPVDKLAAHCQKLGF